MRHATRDRILKEARERDRERIRQLDQAIADIKKNLLPYAPYQWEVDRATRDERDMLRLRVAELEAQIDKMVDASLAAETRSFPSGLGRRPGRPKGKKDAKPRGRRGR